jgi:hypothetical protein
MEVPVGLEIIAGVVVGVVAAVWLLLRLMRRRTR